MKLLLTNTNYDASKAIELAAQFQRKSLSIAVAPLPITIQERYLRFTHGLSHTSKLYQCRFHRHLTHSKSKKKVGKP